MFATDLPPRVALYQTFLKVLSSVPLNNHSSEGTHLLPSKRPSATSTDLRPRARQAFLLLAV